MVDPINEAPDQDFLDQVAAGEGLDTRRGEVSLEGHHLVHHDPEGVDIRSDHIDFRSLPQAGAASVVHNLQFRCEVGRGASQFGLH